MSGTYSLRRRLGLGLAAGVLLIWLAGVVVAGLVVRHELDEAFDSALQETAQRLLPLAVVGILDREGAQTARRIAPLGHHEEFLTYLVRDAEGAVILHSHDADLNDFPARPSHGFIDTREHRIYGEAALSGTIFIEVAEPLEHRREAALESTVSFVVPLALFLPLIVAGAWWIVNRGMRPLTGLRTQIETRGAGDLSPLAADSLPDELRPIADAVNRLMQRLHSSLESERSFTANSAHEIRTPIAGALAKTQRLLSTLPEGDARTRAGEIEAALHGLARLSEKLMQLARAEGGGVLSEQPSDLSPVLVHLVDEFRRDSADGGRIEFEAVATPPLVARMDPDAFGILIRNLLENALKHSPDGTPVEVSVSSDGEIRIVNEGHAVPPETLARLTERFERAGSRTDGSGLGLAIARVIADGAASTLTLRSPATGRTDGFEAAVRLQ